MKKSIFLCFISVMIVNTHVAQKRLDVVRIAFWNIENFFDFFVDNTKSYNACTLDGAALDLVTSVDLATTYRCKLTWCVNLLNSAAHKAPNPDLQIPLSRT
jgi:hypothetical protein